MATAVCEFNIMGHFSFLCFFAVDSQAFGEAACPSSRTWESWSSSWKFCRDTWKISERESKGDGESGTNQHAVKNIHAEHLTAATSAQPHCRSEKGAGTGQRWQAQAERHTSERQSGASAGVLVIGRAWWSKTLLSSALCLTILSDV